MAISVGHRPFDFSDTHQDFFAGWLIVVVGARNRAGREDAAVVDAAEEQ
jgi:hypothetical protein